MRNKNNIVEVDFKKNVKIERLKNEAHKASIRGDYQALHKIINQLQILLGEDLHSFFSNELDKCVIAKGD